MEFKTPLIAAWANTPVHWGNHPISFNMVIQQIMVYS